MWPRRSYSVGMLCKETVCAPPDPNAKHCIWYGAKNNCSGNKTPKFAIVPENQGLVHTNLAPFCVNATLCTNKGARRPVVLLRDSGALQSLVSKKCLAAGDYVDTLEYRLIQGILRQPTEVPLVEVRIESDKLSGKIFMWPGRELSTWSRFSNWEWPARGIALARVSSYEGSNIHHRSKRCRDL